MKTIPAQIQGDILMGHHWLLDPVLGSLQRVAKVVLRLVGIVEHRLGALYFHRVLPVNRVGAWHVGWKPHI